MRQAYNGIGWGKQTWMGTRLADTIGQFPFSLFIQERERLVRLLNYQTKLGCRRSVEDLVRNFKLDENRELREWESTTPLSELEFEIFSDAEIGFSRCHEAAWIVAIIAQLEKFRLENGHYPERLEEVLQPDWSVINLYEFQYAPNGLPFPFVVSPTWVIPAGEPVLFRATEVTASGARLAESLKSVFPAPNDQVQNAIELLKSNEILFANNWFKHKVAPEKTWSDLVQTLNNMPKKTGRIQTPQLRFRMSAE